MAEEKAAVEDKQLLRRALKHLYATLTAPDSAVAVFRAAHAGAFDDAASDGLPHGALDLHRDFRAVVEGELRLFLADEGVDDFDDLFRRLDRVKDDSDPCRRLVEMLATACDFDKFVRMMGGAERQAGVRTGK
jgi:hypothetical protein